MNDTTIAIVGNLVGEPELLNERTTISVTNLAVTSTRPQGSLSAPARAVTGIRPRSGERLPAAGARLAVRAGEPLLNLPAQTPDGRLGLAQFDDHPRLDAHLAEVLEAAGNASAKDDALQAFLQGLLGHVTTVVVTGHRRDLAAEHAADIFRAAADAFEAEWGRRAASPEGG